MKQKLRNKLKSMLKNIICIISFKNILHHGMLKEVNILVYFHFCNEIYQFINKKNYNQIKINKPKINIPIIYKPLLIIKSS